MARPDTPNVPGKTFLKKKPEKSPSFEVPSNPA